jgi:hypothetical protein
MTRRLWIIQLGPELPRWSIAYESVDNPDELTVLPQRYHTRADARRALNDSRQRDAILEEIRST